MKYIEWLLVLLLKLLPLLCFFLRFTFIWPNGGGSRGQRLLVIVSVALASTWVPCFTISLGCAICQHFLAVCLSFSVLFDVAIFCFIFSILWDVNIGYVQIGSSMSTACTAVFNIYCALIEWSTLHRFWLICTDMFQQQLISIFLVFLPG